MKRRIMWLGIVLLATTWLGCESMRENTKKGAGIGAVGGAAVGGIVGHQSGHGWEGALIGGAAGATAGGLLGNQADKANAVNYLSVVDIARMAEEGVPDDVIISEIERTRSKYDLNTETIEYLKSNGVGAEVIDYMLSTGR